MLYYVRRFPDVGTETHQGEALARLVANAGSLTIHAVRVGNNAGLYIDVPEAVTSLVELRVLPALVGMEGCLERRKAFIQRPEWALHALLTPKADAQLLDITVLERSVSTCITLHWTRAGVAGHLWASADDVPLLDRIEQHGWQTRVVPSGVAGRLAVMLHRPTKTTLQPILAQRPPATQTAASPVVMPMSSETPDDIAAGAATKADTTLPPFVAEPGAPGLVLGMDATALPLALAFRPQRLAVNASDAALGELVTILLEQAFELQAGVVAIVPRTVAQELRRSPWRERVRWLDGADPYQSASIPWRSLPPETLDAALLAGNVLPSGSGSMASSFAALLEHTGAAIYATDTVRSLTAPPGDDLRGVVAAGGGVVLVDDGDVCVPLLAALLLHLLAMLPPLQRPIVLFRPDRISVPDGLAHQTFDIVLGTATAAHSMLTQIEDGWTLRSADGSWQRTLLADLRNLTAAPDASAHATLMVGLEGGDDLAASPQARAAADMPVVEELQDESSSGEEADPPVVSPPVAVEPTWDIAASTASASFWDGVDDEVGTALSDAEVSTIAYADLNETSPASGAGSDMEAAGAAVQDDQSFSDDAAEDRAGELPADNLPVLFAHDAVAEEQVVDGLLLLLTHDAVAEEQATDEMAADQALAREPDSDVLDLLTLQAGADMPLLYDPHNLDDRHTEESAVEGTLDFLTLQAGDDAPAQNELLERAALEAIDLQPFSDELHVEAPVVEYTLDLVAHEMLQDGFGDAGTSDLAAREAYADETIVTDGLTNDEDEQGTATDTAMPTLALLDDWNVSLGDDSLVVPQRATTWRRHVRRRRWTARTASATPQEEPSHDRPEREGVLGSVAPLGLDPHTVVRALDGALVQQSDDGAASGTRTATDRTTGATSDDPARVALASSTVDLIAALPAPPAPQLTAVVTPTTGATVSSAPPAPPAALALDLTPVADQLQAGIAEGMGLPALIAQVAPRYPHVAPAVLRAAMRQFIADAGVQLALAPLPASLLPVAPPLDMSTQAPAHVDMSTEETNVLRDADMSTHKTNAQITMSSHETPARVDMSAEETFAQVDMPTADMSTGDISMSTDETFTLVDMSTDETFAQINTPVQVDIPTADIDMFTEETSTLRDVDMSTDETFAQMIMPVQMDMPTADMSTEETLAQVDMSTDETHARVDMSIEETFAQMDMPTGGMSMSTEETPARVDMSTEETCAPLNMPVQMDMPAVGMSMSTEETSARVDMSTEGTFVQVNMSTEETPAQVDMPTADMSMSTDETSTRVDMSPEETCAQVDTDEPLLSTAEAAAELGVTPKTIQRWEDDGKITTLRYGRTRLVPRSEVARLRSIHPSH